MSPAAIGVIVADGTKLLGKLLDRLPADERCHACRALELELARRRVIAQAEARFAARKAK